MKMKSENTNLLVFRTEHNKNYKTINLTCVQDKKLSWKAKGLHNYLITRPPSWEISIGSLTQQSTNGIDSLYTGIRELIKSKYVFRIIKRNEKNQFEKGGYLTTEIPQSIEVIAKKLERQGESWYLKTSGTENPDIGNPQHNREGESNNEKKDNNENKDLMPKIKTRP